MKKSDFHYELPPELIAQSPLPERSASRMLVVAPVPAAFADRQVRDLPEFLQPGDLLVFNDTRVIPARLFGQKDSGGRVEILLERITSGHEVRAQIGASKSPKAGSRITLDEGTVLTVLGRDGEFYRLRFEIDEPMDRVLLRAGRLPLPPFITREPDGEDAERYQTIFARGAGAVAAPTAGTFQPMRVESLHEHQMHVEWLNVGAELCLQIARTRAAGHRVIAVGTTVVRALETAMVERQIKPFAGDTNIFLFPGRAVTSVDALFTNFHLPESTLLMLVSAFAGRERIFAAYRHAIEQRYRFFSYGDAMLLYPQGRDEHGCSTVAGAGCAGATMSRMRFERYRKFKRPFRAVCGIVGGVTSAGGASLRGSSPI